MAKYRNIPQATKDNILHYVNQVYDEAYELGYQHGRRQGKSDIEKTQQMIEDAVKSLQELVRTSPEDFVTDMWDRARIYTKIYADDAPQHKAEKLYQILCGWDEMKEIVSCFKKYEESEE